ncbi:MAG: release factor glutamine methyltransferase [Clostridia bacterium]|jgi:release factor glutamine methyltransferase|nr:HemK family modification methylase [Clostridiales bacterium]MDK2985448.1 release factor glutamine methyltransferase [Clostridia bacterium]
MRKDTISAAITKAADILHKAGIQEGRREAGILMEFCLGISREKMLMELQEILPQDAANKYFDLVKRRSQNYPLQYITGQQEFMGLPFKVNPNVLIPRRETEELVEKVLQSDIKAGANVADVGTGSGAIAVSLARFRPDLRVFATDIDPQALAVARENAGKLDVKIEFFQGDLLKPLILHNIKLDVIVSNPPYISQGEMETLMPEVKYEPRHALEGGKDGLKYYRRIAFQSSQALAKGGRIFLEIGMTQSAEVTAILRTAGFQEMQVIKDYQKRDRIVSAVFGGLDNDT